MHRFNLATKVAIVAGGNGSIEAGVARGLLECGGTVVIAAANAERNDATVAELCKVGPPVGSFLVDITKEQGCSTLVAETVRRHGRLDILVNVGEGGRPSRLAALSAEEWRHVMDVNLTSAVMLSHAAYPELKKAGGGKIINIGWMAANFGDSSWTAYGAAKTGIVQLSKDCAAAWAKYNIQVNTILPGLFDAALPESIQTDTEFVAQVTARIAAGRIGTPDDLAGIAAFLASPASDYLTGADIAVDGGLAWDA